MANGTLIQDLVAGRWRDPTTGQPVRLATRTIAIERSLDGAEADLIAPLALGRRLAVVSDPNTYDALGQHPLTPTDEIACARVCGCERAGPGH